MTLPNFLVIGAMKCGTSSLCATLGQHPEIFVCQPKDTFFFSNDPYYQRGLDWYKSLFECGKGHIAIGEGTDNYTKLVQYPNALPRIVKQLPEAKLIYITRHPLEQLESVWMHRYIVGLESLSFNEALRTNPTYVDTCNYLKQIDAYRQYYEDSRILILFLEDLKNHPNTILRRCFRFLQCDPEIVIPDADKPHNVAADRWENRKVTSYLRRIPLVERVLQTLPASDRLLIRPIFKWHMTSRPQWDKNTRSWVIEKIKANTEAFLERYDKSKDFWPMEA